MSQTTAMGAMSAIEYLDPGAVRFAATEGGFVSMQRGEDFFPRVMFYRAYPFSYPNEFISVRDIEGEELGLIRDLALFDREVQTTIEQQIELRYYAPRILTVQKAKEEFGFIYWECGTTSGEVRFTSRNGPGSVVLVGSGHYIIVDIDGNRFEIPDVSQLDPKDLKKMELFL